MMPVLNGRFMPRVLGGSGEMADTLVLGTSAERCVGSSPTFRTSLSASNYFSEEYDRRAVCGESRTYGSEETCCRLQPAKVWHGL